MKKLYRYVTFFSLVYTSFAYSLEIDERLTSRFLKVSKSMRTVLINRGLEDGLVVGDHAKFFLTTGVIARGYVVKASPMRTIWSIYRLVNTDKLYKDMAVNLKITNPVEVSKDPSKSLYASFPQTQVEVFKGDAMTLDSEMKGKKRDFNMQKGQRDELNEMMTEVPSMRVDKTRTWEIFSTAYYNSLSGQVTEEDGSKFNSRESDISYSLGIEKYFNSDNFILKNLSLYGLVSGGNRIATSPNGEQQESSILEFGGGASLHFLSSPFSVGKMIPFVTGSFGIGSSTIKDNSLSNSSVTTNGEQTNGDTSFISFGLGMKYYTRSGLGFRGLVDLYNKTETYTFQENNGPETKIKRSASGPRFVLGLSYRW